jgi:hypothetical protein
MSVVARVHMPSLGGATGWLNSEPLGPAELRGAVYYVQVSRRTRGLLRRRWPLRAQATAVMPTAGPGSRAAAGFWLDAR